MLFLSKERGGGKETETERQTHSTQTDRKMYEYRHTKERESNTHLIDRNIYTDRHTKERQTQTDSERDRETEAQRDRERQRWGGK